MRPPEKTELPNCPMCGAEHHADLDAGAFRQRAAMANIPAPAVIDDPIATDAIYHLLLPQSSALRIAQTEDERALAITAVEEAGRALGWLTSACEAAGARGLFDSMFRLGYGTYEINVLDPDAQDDSAMPTPANPRLD